ncbi:MAG: PepSY domain-containing protein [Micavibrio sp.]|nr:PepSY domain-containing protein [Micavibrio sp.]
MTPPSIMLSRRILPYVVLLCLSFSLSACTTAKEAEMEKSAKISWSKAKALALEARPGRIRYTELEREKGGSGLRWSFYIRGEGGWYEVDIDAQTGKVLENEISKD